MARKKHTHKYHKVDIVFDKLWACALPNCTHYMPKHLESVLPGKSSICWKCEKEFILDGHNMQDDQPVCSNCSDAVSRVSSALERFGL